MMMSCFGEGGGGEGGGHVGHVGFIPLRLAV